MLEGCICNLRSSYFPAGNNCVKKSSSADSVREELRICPKLQDCPRDCFGRWNVICARLTRGSLKSCQAI